MSPIQTIAVGVRLFSIWLLWYGVMKVFGAYVGARREDYEVSLIPFVIGMALIALIVLSLWFFPTVLARRILPKRADSLGGDGVFEDWFTVGCSVIGIWALSTAIPALGSYLIINYLGQKLYPGSFSVNPDWPLHIAYHVFHLLFGIWLLFGAKGLKKILVWARGR